MRELFLGLVFALLCVVSFEKLESFALTARATADTALEEKKDSLYLPSELSADMISFGYKNALSNLIWFRTINYFGKNFKGSRSYKWLGQMCSVVTALNPRARHSYQFCASLLAWEGDEPELAVTLLTRAIEHFPDDWVFHYLRGFMAWYFMDDAELGHRDLVKAAKLPGAHPIVIRLASKKMMQRAGPQDAIDFLTNVLHATKDEAARKSLLSHLTSLYYEQDLQAIEDAVAHYHEKFGKFPSSREDLAAHSIALKEVAQRKFKDPYGGEYQIDSKSGVVSSTSGKKRPSLTPNQKRKST